MLNVLKDSNMFGISIDTYLDAAYKLRELALNNTIAHTIDTLIEQYKQFNKDSYKEHWSCFLYVEYIITKKYYKFIDEIKDNKELLERLLIRLTLTIEGWNIESIEKLIRRYFGNGYEERFKPFYIFIKELFKIDNKTLNKGRPTISNVVKTIIQSKRKHKNVNTMRHRYSIVNTVNKLTFEDYIYLISVIEPSKGELKNKITELKNICIK